MILDQVLAVLYFFIPAYVANLTPVFVRKLPVLSIPLDGGLKVRGKRLLGDNKTLRGFLFGMILAGLAFWAQKAAYQAGFTSFALIRYSEAWVLSGVVLGFAALSGDLIESFFKRQVGIRPGGRLLFWDQVDFFLAAMLVSINAWILVWPAAVVALALVFLLTVLTQKAGYWLKLKDDPL